MHLAVSLPISIPAVGNRQPAFENQLLAKEISIDKEGFLYIFVANESPYPEISGGVWFDDFTVEVTKSPVAAVSSSRSGRCCRKTAKSRKMINQQIPARLECTRPDRC